MSLREFQNVISYFNISWVDVINSVSTANVTADDFILIEYYEGAPTLAKLIGEEVEKKSLADRFSVHFIYEHRALLGKGLFTDILTQFTQELPKKCFSELSSSFYPVMSHMYNSVYLEQSTKFEAEKFVKEAAESVSRIIGLDKNLPLIIKQEIQRKLESLETRISYAEPEWSLEQVEEIYGKLNLTGFEGKFWRLKKLATIEKSRMKYNLSNKYDAQENVLCKISFLHLSRT